MKAAIAEKISTYIFAALLVLSVVVFGLFYGVGFDNMSQVAAGMVIDPQFTDVLMYWMYGLLAISVICVLIFGLIQFIAKLKENPLGALKSLSGVILLIVLFGGAYAVASDETMVIAGKAFENKSILILTDVCIYVQYVLLLVTVLCTVASVSGIFKASNKIK
ncbi:MAG: hypothetical protein IKA41_08500 [Bacteroidaceae bacterium]|nr:hypothetical protein [Bacteroidaceae bacterium]